MKKLAILGASYLQEPLIKKANELGYETHCFAWPKDAVCKDICNFYYPISTTDKEKILEICSNLDINGITSIASDVAVPTISFVASCLNLVGNSVRSSQISTNKFLMREALSLAKINSPAYQLIDDPKGKLDKSLKFPVVIKPIDRSGSRGVSKVNNVEQLRKSLVNAIGLSFTGMAIIENYLDGPEVSVESISWNGQHFILAITDKVTTGPPNFVEIAHHQPSIIDINLKSKIIDITKQALDALDIQFGASHTEIKISDNEAFIIEVGARMGGDFIGSDLVFNSTGYDYLKATIQVSLGIFIPPENLAQVCTGVYFASQKSEYVYDYIKNSEIYPEIIKANCFSKEKTVLKSSEDRFGFFIYKSTKRFQI